MNTGRFWVLDTQNSFCYNLSIGKGNQMAYYSQEMKRKVAPKVKEILKKYNLKGSLSVDNHSTVCLKITSGNLDFIENFNRVVEEHPEGFRSGYAATTYISVNPYHFDKHFTEVCRDFLTEVLQVLNEGNHDNSDIQTDYFDVGWYVDVRIGTYDKPYILEN